MEGLNRAFLFIVNMSITATYAAAAVILIRFLVLRRLPKIFSYSLWAILLFRLVSPISFSSVFSFFNLLKLKMQESVIQYIPRNIGTMKSPAINTGLNSINNIINPYLPRANEAASVNPMQLIIFTASVIWITGIAALIIYSICTYYKMLSKIRTAVLLNDKSICEAFDEIGLKRKIKVYRSEHIISPFVCGFITPRIYLPACISQKEVLYILTHELLHVKRFDYLIKPLSYLILMIHWFNPILWLSINLMIKDMEMSCDEKVMNILGSSIKCDYSNSLLSLAVKRNKISLGSPLAFGESDVKSRIKNILNFRRPSFYIAAVMAVIIIAAGFILLSNPDNNVPASNVQPNSSQTQPQGIEDGNFSYGDELTFYDNDVKTSKNPTAISVVTKHLEAKKENDYDAWLSTMTPELKSGFLANSVHELGVISLDILDVHYEKDTSYKHNILKSEKAIQYGLTADNIAVIYALFDVKYDHTKVPDNDGKIEWHYTLIRKDKSSPWQIQGWGYGSGGI